MRRGASHGRDGRGSGCYLVVDCRQVAGYRNAEDCASPENWWDVQFTVVLQRKQIGMRKQKCQAAGIALKPELGHKDRGRNTIGDQCVGDTLVKCTGTGIECESNDQTIGWHVGEAPQWF